MKTLTNTNRKTNTNTKNAFKRVKYPMQPSMAIGATTASPIARLHTAVARSRSHQPLHSHPRSSQIKPARPTSPTSPSIPASPTLETLQFILVPTCMTRQTKRGLLGKPIELSQLQYPAASSTQPHDIAKPRSDLLIALQPRTPLEKLIHRRAIWIQQWWRRMAANVLYVRARKLQSYVRMWLGKRMQIQIIHRNRKCKRLLLRIQHKYTSLILLKWRKIYLARVMGVRLKYSVYHIHLLTFVWNSWKADWQVQHDQNEKTIFFFHRWMNNRRRWYYWLEWRNYIWLRKQLRHFCVRRHLLAFAKYVRLINQHKHRAIAMGRLKLENTSASIIQIAYFEYANRLSSIAGNNDLTLEELHHYATLIQKRLARGPQGRRRFLAHQCTHFSLNDIMRNVNKICHYQSTKNVKESKIRFELHRSERERTFLAECENMCLKTQKQWEDSKEGKRDILNAKTRMMSGNQVVCLLNNKQRTTYLQEESLRRGRAKRKNDALNKALEEYRGIDPPLYACGYCVSAFAVVEDFESHKCTHNMKDGPCGPHGVNIHSGFRKVRLIEEVAKLTANDLIGALTLAR
jgi:hypothetical protein